MGYAGVVDVNGVRISGLSGIYKGHDHRKGHFEKPPYDNSTQRSVYHIRNLERLLENYCVYMFSNIQLKWSLLLRAAEQLHT